MRPVLLAALIVFLPVAHALSVWTPLRRVQVRAWALAFAVLLADAAVLTMFAVTNSVMDQPEGVDRLMFGTFGVLLAALAPAALARIVGTPELHTAVQSMSRGSKVIAAGAGAAAIKGTMLAHRVENNARRPGGGPAAGTALMAAGPGGGSSGGPHGGSGRPGGPGGGGGAAGSATGGSAGRPGAGRSSGSRPSSPATTSSGQGPAASAAGTAGSSGSSVSAPTGRSAAAGRRAGMAGRADATGSGSRS